jgi:spore maturation protein CgeB
LKIIYSFNKKGYEGQCWEQEIKASSTEEITFIPFNHQYYLDPGLYANATDLDILYQQRDPRLLRLYSDIQLCIVENNADAIIVANCPPYHPDFLKKLNLYKALYSADDPGATYAINIPYLHAYDHVFFVCPSYSADMDMPEKMKYAGAMNADWLPISVFDFECLPFEPKERDIDIIYIGGFWVQKITTLVKLKKAFGSRLKIFGYFRIKHNLYLNICFGFKSWIKSVSFQERVQLYQRAKIGINMHWNEFGLGNQRLYHLPANGVMQICDCPDYLNQVFDVGIEVVSYKSVDDLIDKIKYYLAHEIEREKIALAGYKRAMRDYRFSKITQEAGRLMKSGIIRKKIIEKSGGI